MMTASAPSRSDGGGPVSSAPLFELGRVVATPGALACLNEAGVHAFTLLRRHQRGDFGELCAEDRQANVDAIEFGARVFSFYAVGAARVWIITEAVGDGGHRASTCLLLPEEY